MLSIRLAIRKMRAIPFLLLYIVTSVFLLRQSGASDLSPFRLRRSKDGQQSSRHKAYANVSTTIGSDNNRRNNGQDWSNNHSNQQPCNTQHDNQRQEEIMASQANSNGKRNAPVPFWNIGHMINSIEQVDEVMRLLTKATFFLKTQRNGANGIETDVSFDYVPDPPLESSYTQQDVHPIKASAFHGLPCDCFRLCFNQEEFVKFLRHIKKLTTWPNNTLTVMLLDLKLTTKELANEKKKAFVGDYLAHTLMNELYRDLSSYRKMQPIRTIISINHVTDHMVVRTFIDRLKHERLEQRMQYIGFDVGMNDKLDNITAMWDHLNDGKRLNVWQGDGLTNCANIVRPLERLKEAIAVRNLHGHFRKVYYWTVDVKSQVRNILRLGLDALLTNQPERIVSVLGEDEFKSKYRLATVDDNPFQQLNIEPLPWKLPCLAELEETVQNIRETGSEYFHKLPEGIASVLKKKLSTIIADSGFV